MDLPSPFPSRRRATRPPAARLLFAALVASSAACTPQEGRPEGPESPAGATSGEEHVAWHRVLLEERPAGHLRATERPRDAGGWTRTTTLELSIRRGDTPLRLRAAEEVEEDEAGRVLRFRVEKEMSRRDLTVRGVAQDGSMQIETRVQGYPPRSQAVDLAPDTVGPVRARRRIRRRLGDEGATLEFPVFHTELRRSVTQRVEIGPLEEVRLPGGPRTLRRVTVEIEGDPTGPVVQWLDDEARIVRSRASILGREMVTLRTTRREALATGDAPAAEVFTSLAVPLDRDVPEGSGRVVWRLRWTGEAAAPEGFPPAGVSGQRVLERGTDGRSWTLEVRAVRAPEGAPFPPPRSDSPGPWRAAGTWVQSDLPRMRRVAREQTAGAAGAGEAARRLARWVHANVEEKDLETSFASAAEVLESRAGDCTEHAVLLCALARAVDLPARVVAGLVVHRGRLVGHMWTEVRCAGTWVPYDATRPSGRVGAGRIGIALSSLADEGVQDVFLGLAAVLGNLEVEVVEAGSG